MIYIRKLELFFALLFMVSCVESAFIESIRVASYPISYVSRGFEQITIFEKQNLNNNLNSVWLLDLAQNTEFLLAQNVELKSNIIKSPNFPLPKNTASSNFYLDEWSNSSIFTKNFTETFMDIIVPEQALNTKASFWNELQTPVIIFNKLNTFEMNRYQKILIRNRTAPRRYQVFDISYEKDKLFVFVESTETVGGVGWFQAHILMPNLSWNVIRINIYRKETIWATSQNNLALYTKYTIAIFKWTQTGFVQHLLFKTDRKAISMAINDKYLIVSFGNRVRQYSVETGERISSSDLYPDGNVSVGFVQGMDICYMWSYGQRWVRIVQFNDVFGCGSEAPPDPTQCTIQPTIFQNDINFQPVISFQPVEVFPQPQIQEEQKKEEEEKSPVVLMPFCLYQNSSYCQQVCSVQCENCIKHEKKCVQCDKFYEKDENENCQITSQSQTIISTFAAANMIKGISTQSVAIMLFLDRFQLYNFHKKQYLGAFGNALQTLDFIEENAWSIIAVPEVLDFLNDPLPLPNYNAYTNPRFLENRRSSALFFQNAKKYFVFAVPFSLFTFVVMNRLFWILSKHKVSLLLRNFSFWLTLGAMLSVQNISLLNYYFLQNLQTLFALSFVVRVTNLVTLFLYGAFLTFCISFVPFAFYLYRRLSAHFLNNAKVIITSYIFEIIGSILRPILQGFIQIYLFNEQILQITLMATVSLCFCLALFVFQLSFSFSYSKFSFSFTCILELSFFVLNILLIVDIQNEDMREIIDLSVYSLMYICFVSTILLLLESLFSFLYEVCFCFKKNSFQKSKNIKISFQFSKHFLNQQNISKKPTKKLKKNYQNFILNQNKIGKFSSTLKSSKTFSSKQTIKRRFQYSEKKV